MTKIIIVGAGQIGSRHLQALAKVKRQISIHVYDSSQAALDVARARYEEVAAGSTNTVSFSTESHYPRDADLAIIATSARPRLAVLKDICSRVELRYVILEKVLFQRLEEYDEAEQVLAASSVERASVNLPARQLEFYAEAREQLAKEQTANLAWIGSQWGLGCNGVHAIDAAEWIFGSAVEDVDTSSLDRTLVPSKRSGYFEFTGTLKVRLGGGQLVTLTSYRDGTQPLGARIDTSSSQRLWDMPISAMRWRDANTSWEWRDRVLRQRLQSELTTEVVEDLLMTGQTVLPTYTESARLHRKFLGALLGHMAEIGESTKDGCPIT